MFVKRGLVLLQTKASRDSFSYIRIILIKMPTFKLLNRINNKTNNSHNSSLSLFNNLVLIIRIVHQSICHLKIKLIVLRKISKIIKKMFKCRKFPKIIIPLSTECSMKNKKLNPNMMKIQWISFWTDFGLDH